MNIVSNTVNYLDGDVLLQGFFAYDADIQGVRPVVLVHHTWAGRDNFVAEKARQLAALGYLAFAADMYGQGKLGATPEDCAGLMQPFVQDRRKLQQRVLAAYAAVKLLPWADNARIAAIGFCFGGMCALDLARSGADVAGVVSFHGLLAAPAHMAPAEIRAKILVLHGHDDPMAPPGQVAELQAELTGAGVDWQVHCYGKTMHAFTNPVANNPQAGTVYQPIAERRSWLAMQNFLAEIFAVGVEA